MDELTDDDKQRILAIVASISSIIQFLTGILVCQKIILNKSSLFISSFPFISGCLLTSLWLNYGFLTNNIFIIRVNSVGVTLSCIYVFIFLLYSSKKTVVIHQLLVCLGFLLCTLLLVGHTKDKEDSVSYFGFICCMTNIWFFVSPLASFFHGINVKSSEGLSYPMIVLTFVVSLLWMIYGMLLKDKFIQIPNFLGCLLSGFQLSLFAKYPDNKQSKIYSTSNI